MTSLPAWTPGEVRLLRKVQNKNQRVFADRLGYVQSTVVNWENPERTGPLPPDTIGVLNTELSRLSPTEREEFDRERGVASGQLGAGSAVRTANLLTTVTSAAGPLRYDAPDQLVDAIGQFLDSSARVFMLSGAAGTGKTTLTRHVARHFAARSDCQLLTVSAWEPPAVDLAVEILRYASIPRGADALLTLEQHASGLTRPCLVIIDGIASHDTFAAIGRHIDMILRQVTGSALRFLLTVRTPPNVETTAYPLLHASLYGGAGDPGSADRYTLTPWSDRQARLHWEQATDTPFDMLPDGVARLVRTPLYMKLALDAPPKAASSDVSAYALLDHCVRRVLGEGNTGPRFAALTTLAQHHSRDDIPTALTSELGNNQALELPADLPTALICVDQHQRVEFTHDVLREYFVSARIADELHSRGRPATTVQALNQMAGRAAHSGSARNMFELVVQRLDSLSPALLGSVATAPTASPTSTVPLMVSLAREARYLTPDVLRACADRAEQDSSPALSRSLLLNARLHHALGSGRYRWLLTLLRRFGALLWTEIRTFVEDTFTSADAYTLLDLANLADDYEATFFARHFYLFFADTAETTLENFLSHPTWRVRAALAEALGDTTVVVDETALTVMNRLVGDPDYKVRAAVAPLIARAPDSTAVHHVAALLNDHNWHVRERTLLGLNQLGIPARRPVLIQAALSTMDREASWSTTPSHIRPSQERLRILHTPPDSSSSDEPQVAEDDHRAMVTILREIRTGYITPPADLLDELIERGKRSQQRLIRREAERVAAARTTGGHDTHRVHEWFRRTRNHRAIQVALDLHSIADAIRVACAAAAAGVDFIEVGDPLIKEVGVDAIAQIKSAVEGTPVVAEMMSADWGRDQVVLAAQAGADIVQLIGPATAASVRAAVNAGQRLAVPVLLDVPRNATHHWITEMERAGIDGFTVTTNIDVGIGSTTPLDAARTVRNWTALPVSVSGGFSPTDTSVFTDPDWDILIVGRGVADAVDPVAAAMNLVERVHHSERQL